MKRLIILLALLFAAPATAQTFPELTGRVVDQANLLTPEQETEVTQRLEALERASSRQLVIATLPSLEDHPIEDYGYRLGRHWRLGQEGANNGAILIVAPNERKVRIEVGYGLEGILTDALSSQIIQNDILPRFRNNDYPGGIMAGVEAIIQQLQAPPEVAEQRALQAAESQREEEEGGSAFPLIFWGIVLFFIIVMPMVRSGFGGRRYRGRRRGYGGPIIIWGPGTDGWGGGSSSSSWGGGSSGGGGFGGFSGGGGSFGGGGASGGW